MGKQFRVAIGLNYGDEDKRAEPGALVSDLPESDIENLLALGAIEPVKQKTSKGKGSA